MKNTLLLLLLAFSSYVHAQNSDVKKRGEKFIYVAEHKLFKTRYDSIRNFSDGKAAVKKKGHWGFIDSSGTVVVPLEHDSVTDYHGGLASVRQAGFSWRLLLPDGTYGDEIGRKPVAYFDSLTVVPHRKYSGYTYNDKNTAYTIWKHPGEIVYDHIDSFQQHGNQLLICYAPARYSYQQRVYAQLINFRGDTLTPAFEYVEDIFQHPVIITFRSAYQEALLNPDGTMSPTYNDITHIRNELYLAEQENKMGVMNGDFSMLIPAEYTMIRETGTNFLLYKDSAYRIADSNGVLLTSQFVACTPIGNDLFLVKANAADAFTFLMNSDGERVSNDYGEIFPPSDGIYRVISKDFMQYTYINAQGRQIAPWYDRGVIPAVTYTEDNSGAPGWFRGITFLMTMGISEMAGMFDGPKAVVAPGEKYPYEKFPGNSDDNRYYYGNDFHNGVAVYSVKRSAKGRESSSKKYQYVSFGLIDTSGKIILTAKYDDLTFENGYVHTELNYHYGLCTMTGTELLKPQYSGIHYFGRGYFSVSNDREFDSDLDALFYTNDTTGKFLTPFRYWHIEEGGDSAFIVNTDGFHSGYVNLEGKVIIAPKYRNAEPFRKDGRARVAIRWGEWFYIDKNGRRVE